MSLQNIRKELDDKRISAVELTEIYLKKIKEKDSEFNSYITVCEESAIKDAENAQLLINNNSSKPLTGIPLSIKDNICTKGIRTTCASKMLSDFVPFYDACVVERLKAENAVILGKNNMDEFAMGSSNQTSYFGAVKNPVDITCVAGGSSGGSAASVCADLCAASIGTDTGGSVRQPAAFCGVTGLKPTYGTVSRYGLIAFASSLDQIGIIAKSAKDTGFILNSIYGTDERDATTSAYAKGDYLSQIGCSIKNLKIGIPKEFFDGVDDEIKESVICAAKFYEKNGAIIKNVSLPSLEYAVSAYYLISSAEAASNLSRYDGIKYGHRADNCTTYEELICRSRKEGFGKEVKRRIMLGNYALSSGYYDDFYKNAVMIREKIKAEYNEIFSDCDVILTPTTPTTAYKADFCDNSPVKTYLSDICTVTVNIAGLPAISTTCGYDRNNMPIGISIVGRAFDEAKIISLADNFEKNFKRQEVIL